MDTIKFDSTKHADLAATLPFSYLSSALYLDFWALIREENGRQMICWQDPDEKETNQLPEIFLPPSKELWPKRAFCRVNSQEIEQLKFLKIPILFQELAHYEYFYKTESFLNPTGKTGQRIRQFQRTYNYKPYSEYDPKKLKNFLDIWRTQKNRERHNDEFLYSNLANAKKYGLRQIYVEIDNQLAGFAIGAPHSDNRWIGLHLKTLYKFNGLSRFLHHERAKLFKNFAELTLCSDSDDPGIKKYKESLGPSEIREYYYIRTGSLATNPSPSLNPPPTGIHSAFPLLR